jgi:hypothetical protein
MFETITKTPIIEKKIPNICKNSIFVFKISAERIKTKMGTERLIISALFDVV